ALMYFVFAAITLAMGIWLTQASSRLKPMHANSFDILKEGVAKLAAVIRLQGIMVLVVIVIMILFFILGGIGAFVAAMSNS
ncbi:MAG: DUF5362 family protein, partial [Phycisphaeraceae bacterium]|nr:DUF5362 family protein [Phycisphaeraceae bacterium]